MAYRLRRFWDSASATCSYLVGSDHSRLGVFIDPVRQHIPLYLGVLEELGYRLAGVLETHAHADHVTAAGELRRLTGCAIACSRESGIQGADRLLADGEAIDFGPLAFVALATPGHTPACLTYRWQDRLFTGDTLLIGRCGRTDEPGGNPGQLFDSISRRLLTLPDELLIHPGHGSQSRWVSCIGEEKRTNPMLTGVSRDEFIALSRRHQEAPIADLEAMLAANRRCGETTPETDPNFSSSSARQP